MLNIKIIIDYFKRLLMGKTNTPHLRYLIIDKKTNEPEALALGTSAILEFLNISHRSLNNFMDYCKTGKTLSKKWMSKYPHLFEKYKIYNADTYELENNVLFEFSPHLPNL